MFNQIEKNIIFSNIVYISLLYGTYLRVLFSFHTQLSSRVYCYLNYLNKQH